jgi:HrpA-like RNA helicase
MEHSYAGMAYIIGSILWRLIYCHSKQSHGDILVFLTGRDEIERCLEELSEYLPT